VDFTQEGRRKVNLFGYVLGYSRRQYLHFTASQDLQTTLREYYEVAEVVYRTVDAEGMVPYAQNHYSVPWQYIGQVLPVRITDEEVTIYDSRLEVLARHSRFPPTEKHRQSRRPEHLPPRDVQRRRETLQERFSELGPLAVRFLEGLLTTQRCGWDQAQKVLALLSIYRREDVLAALQRAVRYGAFSAKSVERILAVQGATEDGSGPHGRRRIFAPEGPAVRRSHPAAARDGLPTPLVRGVRPP
jgi:hypothetical protein